MKKSSIIAFVALVVASGFTGCSKSEIAEAPEAEQATGNFDIFAEITKTTIDGMDTKWADGDAINLFHIGKSDWDAKNWDKFVSDGKFTLADAGTGRFVGDTSKAKAPCRWYAFYPYGSYNQSPALPGYMSIGCSSGLQTQDGNNSSAHLAGKYFPLVAQSDKTWYSTGTVTLQFKPALSIVKLHVTNNSDKPLTVTSASISSAYNIAGSFYIKFTETTPVFEPKDAKTTASLTVTDGEELAIGESADFYIAIAPFTNEEGKQISFMVNGCEKTTDAAMSFEGGKVKTVNFNYDLVEKDYSGSYVVLAHYVSQSVDKYYAVDGTSAQSYRPAAEFDYDGSKEEVEVTNPDLFWNVVKKNGTYHMKSGNDLYLGYKSGNNAQVAADTSDLTYYTLSFTPWGKYIKVALADLAVRQFRYNYNNGKPRFAFYTSDVTTDQLLFVKAKLKVAPVINLTDPDKVAAAGAKGVSVPYEIKYPVAGTKATAENTADWITNLAVGESAITFDVKENTSSDERSADVTVKYDGAEDKTFTVTQEAKGKSSYVWTLANGDLTTKGGTKTVSDKTWSYPTITYVGFETRGFQIGSSKLPQESFYLKTSDFGAAVIKSIKVNASKGNDGDAKLSISVGGKGVLNDQALTTSSADYEASSIDKSGEIIISFAATKKSYFLKSITIEYQPAE